MFLLCPMCGFMMRGFMRRPQALGTFVPEGGFCFLYFFLSFSSIPFHGAGFSCLQGKGKNLARPTLPPCAPVAALLHCAVAPLSLFPFSFLFLVTHGLRTPCGSCFRRQSLSCVAEAVVRNTRSCFFLSFFSSFSFWSLTPPSLSLSSLAPCPPRGRRCIFLV